MLSLVLDNNQFKLIKQDIKIAPTNGRGELLGLIHAFIYIINEYKQTGIKRPIYVIEDATYGLYMINFRIWNYLLTDENLTFVNVNHDLVIIIRDLLIELSSEK